MKKRFLAVLLVLAVALGSFGQAGQINRVTKVQAASSDVQISESNMASTILKLKNRLRIGDEFTSTDYNYYEGTNGVNWNFYWRTADYSKNINVSCDGYGRISSVYRYDNSGSTVPTFTSDELKDYAMSFAAEIAPETKGHLVLRSVYPSLYNSSYTYNFYRVENGIEMPDNYVAISINYNDKSLRNFEANWLYDTKIPAATGLISKDDATAKIGKKVDMELRYYITYDVEGNPKAYLAYTPDRSYIAVDAKTGEIYKEKTYWNRSDKGMSDNAVAEDKAAAAGEFNATLSEAELALIAELKDIIPAEQVVKNLRANKYLLIEKSASNSTWNLSNDGNGNYYWNITMRDNRPYDWENNDYYRAYAYAYVNAKTGELLSFNSSVKSYYEFTEEEILTIKANYKKSECRNIFADFVNTVNRERFAQTKLSSTIKTHEIAYNEKKNKYTYAGFAFEYDRFFDGIEVSGNYISGQVDAVTGKVYSYSYNWNDDVKFPEAKNILSEKKAMAAYLGYQGYDLVYEVVTDYKDGAFYADAVQSIRLVYRTEISPAIVDAFTGKQLNWNGDEYVNTEKGYNYTDIAGHEYERSIKILASMGAGFEATEFKPDKAITEAEFQNLMNSISMFFNYREASENSTEKLSREEAAKIIVSSFGYDKVAELDIYKTGYKDESKISAGYTGYVAIAKGLGIMDGDKNGNFNPNKSLTRGAAADLLIKAIGIR